MATSQLRTWKKVIAAVQCETGPPKEVIDRFVELVATAKPSRRREVEDLFTDLPPKTWKGVEAAILALLQSDTQSALNFIGGIPFRPPHFSDDFFRAFARELLCTTPHSHKLDVLMDVQGEFVRRLVSLLPKPTRNGMNVFAEPHSLETFARLQGIARELVTSLGRKISRIEQGRMDGVTAEIFRKVRDDMGLPLGDELRALQMIIIDASGPFPVMLGLERIYNLVRPNLGAAAAVVRLICDTVEQSELYRAYEELHRPVKMVRDVWQLES